jgi:Gluconate 2-dehydrogenase subunit 3
VTAGALTAQRDLLAAVLDTLVPAGGDFPGAGAVALDHVLATAAASADLESLLVRGLELIEATARAAGVPGFARLGVDECETILKSVERSHVDFFEALVRHAYDGYYAHPMIVTRLGLDPGPLHPRGHQIEALDAPDLSRVIARGPLYRRA